MRLALVLLAAIPALLGTTGAAMAQVGLPPSQYPLGDPVVLTPLTRTAVGSDLATTPASSQPTGPTVPLAYLNARPEAGTAKLYRLARNAGVDSMDSKSLFEPGYLFNSLLGNAWTGRAWPGMISVVRAFNPTTGDHGTFGADESLPVGYVAEGSLGFAYSRPHANVPELLSTTAGGVTVRSNLAAGGAIWEWVDDGFQYINDFDYGRQIQAAFFTEGLNPTEAGSKFTDSARAPNRRQESPLIAASSGGGTQVTSSAALEWNPDRYGGSADSPVLWSGVELGKELSLNYDGLGSVAKYTTVLTLPTALPRSGSSASLEMPTPYLRGMFNRFWTYDAGSAQGPVDITTDVPCQQGGPRFAPPSGFGGIIVTDGPGADARAMGVYGVTRQHGGPVSYFQHVNHLRDVSGTGCANPGTGQYDYATAKMTVINETGVAGGFPSGVSRYNAWVISGTRAEVTAAMDALRDGGAR